jgi:hypothetical protein
MKKQTAGLPLHSHYGFLGALAVQNVLGVLRALAVQKTYPAPKITATNP